MLLGEGRVNIPQNDHLNRSDCIEQGWQSIWTKYSPPLLFVNKILWENLNTHMFMAVFMLQIYDFQSLSYLWPFTENACSLLIQKI